MTRSFSTLFLAALLPLASAPASPAADKDEPARTDAHGDPLPPGALLRLGTVRWRSCARFLAFTPDGKTLVTGEYPPASVIRCWDVETGKETGGFAVDGELWAVALAPDGKTLAVSSKSQGIVFRSVPDGKLVRRLQPADAAPDQGLVFLRLDFSADGKILAAAANDSEVHLFEAATGKTILHLPVVVAGRCLPTALSADGAKAAVVGANNTLRVVEIATEKEVFKQAPPHASRPLNASLSPDGDKLAWMGEDANTFALWDVASGKPVLQFRGPAEIVDSVQFSPDGKRVAARYSGKEGGCIRLWDAATAKELRTFDVPGPAGEAFAFSPDGKRLAAGHDFDGVVHLWDAETGKELPRFGEQQGLVCSAAFSPDGRAALTGCMDGVLRVWDAGRGTVARRIEVGGGGYPSYEVSFSGDRKTAAVSGNQNVVGIWDLDSGKKKTELGGDDPARGGVLSPDGKLLASHGRASDLLLWDAAAGKLARRVGAGANGLGNFAFSPDGKTLVALQPAGNPALSEAMDMCLWEVASGNKRGQWTTHGGSGFAVRFSPDGRRIALIATNRVDLWDPSGPKETASLVVPKDAPDPGFLLCLAFSPDGRTLAAGSYAGPIYLWEVATGNLRAVLTGHRARVVSLDFSPDGARLISGSHDTTALIWDLTGLAGDKGAKALPPERLASLWDDLADADAGKAWRAGWRLAADPAAAVPFLQERLHPAEADANHIAQLLAALDGDDFEGREQASHELAKLGDLAGPAVRKALEGNPSSEGRRRLEELAAKLDGPVEDAEQARALRSVEVLEHIGTPEARRLLDELGKGAAGARLTRDAKVAAARLAASSNP